MEKLSKKNYTLEEARKILGNPDKKKKKKNKRIHKRGSTGGLGVNRNHPLIFKLGGYSGKGII